MEEKQRRPVRPKREQLLTLLNGWDPAGLLASGAPRDEYDFLVDILLNFLSRNATKEEIAQFLDKEVLEHFGVAPKGTAQFANRARTWFELASSEPS